ncbi:MAG: alpha/beta hydrolase [Bacteroidota bacterium]
MMRPARKLVVGLLAILIVLVIVYMATNNKQETKVLDDVARNSAPGQFVTLSDGVTHYQLFGPDTGKQILLIHGGGIAGFEVWNQTIPFLVSKGYRVLTYDLYGRGYSDRPNIEYTPELLARQASELTAELHFTKELSIISMSMGSMVALDYRAEHSDQVKDLVMISPSAAGTYKSSKLLKIPVVSSLLMTFYWYPRAVENQRKEFVDQALFDQYAKRLEYFMNFEGYKHVNYSTWMHTLNQSKLEMFKEVPPNRILIIHGEKDPYFPAGSISVYSGVYPTVKDTTIANAGHMAHFERPAETNPVIFDFLNTLR